jgi:hypothetical protein
MKHIFSIVLFSGLLLLSIGTVNAAIIKAPLNGDPRLLTEAREEAIAKRVQDIQSMDISSLNKSQRKELRNELKGFYKEVKNYDDDGRHHYVYISVGALIVIILLLILILR